MNVKSLLFASASLVLASGPVLAQTRATPQFISQASTDDWRASQLAGVDILGQNNESIGKVDDVILDKSGNVKAFVVGVGGFLGLGEKRIALPFGAFTWTSQEENTGRSSSNDAAGNRPNDYPDHGKIDMTKDQLTSAPEFHYASEKPSKG